MPNHEINEKNWTVDWNIDDSTTTSLQNEATYNCRPSGYTSSYVFGSAGKTSMAKK